MQASHSSVTVGHASREATCQKKEEEEGGVRWGGVHPSHSDARLPGMQASLSRDMLWGPKSSPSQMQLITKARGDFRPTDEIGSPMPHHATVSTFRPKQPPAFQEKFASKQPVPPSCYRANDLPRQVVRSGTRLPLQHPPLVHAPHPTCCASTPSLCCWQSR